MMIKVAATTFYLGIATIGSAYAGDDEGMKVCEHDPNLFMKTLNGLDFAVKTGDKKRNISSIEKHPDKELSIKAEKVASINIATASTFCVYQPERVNADASPGPCSDKASIQCCGKYRMQRFSIDFQRSSMEETRLHEVYIEVIKRFRLGQTPASKCFALGSGNGPKLYLESYDLSRKNGSSIFLTELSSEEDVRKQGTFVHVQNNR